MLTQRRVGDGGVFTQQRKIDHDQQISSQRSGVGGQLFRTGLERGDCIPHGRIDVGVVEIGQGAVILQGCHEVGISVGYGEHHTFGMKGLDESGDGEAGRVVDIVQR